MIRLLIFLFFTPIVAATVSAQCTDRFLTPESDSFLLHKNIYFGENISENGELTTLKLDVFEPVIPSDEPRPLVIMVHGGSFTGGSKEMGEVVWFCEDLAKRGIVAASINYRVESDPISLISPEKMVKAVVRAVEDVKASIRFFHKNIEESNDWNIDPEAILLGGTSAGSIANLHAVFMDEFSALKPAYKSWVIDLGIDTIGMHGNSGNPGYSEEIKGLINISGAIVDVDFLNNNADMPIINIHNAIDLAVPYTYGYPYFIPTLPIVAGSRPIHFRMDSIGGVTKLVTVQSLNHIPHTSWEGEQLQPVYDDLLREILHFVADNSPCNEIPTPVQTTLMDNVRIYPNPVKDRLMIQGIEDIDQFDLELVRLDGSIVLKDLNTDNQAIRIPELLQGTGMYILTGIHRRSGDMFTLPLLLH